MKGRAPASSQSLVTCCWSGNGLLLITPLVIRLGEDAVFMLIKNGHGVLRNHCNFKKSKLMIPPDSVG